MQVFGPLTLSLFLLAPASQDGTQAVPAGSFEVHGTSQWVDANTTERGIAVRLGNAADEWSVELVDRSKQTPVVEATLRGPDNQSTNRTIELQGETDEARSRELAAVMTLWIEQATSSIPDQEAGADSTQNSETPSQPSDAPSQTSETPSQPSETPTSKPPESTQSSLRPPKWWLGGGARLELGGSPVVSPSGGLGVRGGFWVRNYLQPLFELEWIGSQKASSLHALSFGAGLGAGMWLKPQKIWLGGAAIPHLEIVGARGSENRTEALFGADLLAMGQLRWQNMLFGLRTGIALNAPSTAVAGNNSVIIWNNVRWVLGFTVGWVWS